MVLSLDEVMGHGVAAVRHVPRLAAPGASVSYAPWHSRKLHDFILTPPYLSAKNVFSMYGGEIVLCKMPIAMSPKR